jgi:hypothetical protein
LDTEPYNSRQRRSQTPLRTTAVDGTLVLRKDWLWRFCVDSTAADFAFIFAMRLYGLVESPGQSIGNRLWSGYTGSGKYTAMQQLYFVGIAFSDADSCMRVEL